DQHREVGLAAGTGERSRDVALLAARRLYPHNQHVLGEPALRPPHAGRYAQRQALLAEQRVAAVAAAEGPDRVVLREVNDVFMLGITWPGDVCVSWRERHADGMQA